MKKNNNYNCRLNNSISDFLKNALSIISKKPAMTKFALQTIRFQRMAADRRVEYQKQKNVIPVISMEGLENETDYRRGTGVYNRLRDTLIKMKNAGIFFGTSFTVTKMNFDTLTNVAFIKNLIESGAELFFYVEYIPVKETTEDIVITDEQRSTLSAILDSFKTNLHGLFVSFPGDEEAFGGCLSAGRGFIHISAEGNLEPCPFAPYSDTNLKDLSLKEALQSKLLSEIRQNHAELTETKVGCTLWENRKWLKSLSELPTT